MFKSQRPTLQNTNHKTQYSLSATTADLFAFNKLDLTLVTGSYIWPSTLEGRPTQIPGILHQ